MSDQFDAELKWRIANLAVLEATAEFEDKLSWMLKEVNGRLGYKKSLHPLTYDVSSALQNTWESRYRSVLAKGNVNLAFTYNTDYYGVDGISVVVTRWDDKGKRVIADERMWLPRSAEIERIAKYFGRIPKCTPEELVALDYKLGTSSDPIYARMMMLCQRPQCW